MTNSDFEKRISALRSAHEELIGRKNPAADSNGVWTRYTYPILTAAHTPLFWRYDLNPATNPFLLERFGSNQVRRQIRAGGPGRRERPQILFRFG